MRTFRIFKSSETYTRVNLSGFVSLNLTRYRPAVRLHDKHLSASCLEIAPWNHGRSSPVDGENKFSTIFVMHSRSGPNRLINTATWSAVTAARRAFSITPSPKAIAKATSGVSKECGGGVGSISFKDRVYFY